VFAFAFFDVKDAQLVWNQAFKNHLDQMLCELKRNVSITQNVCVFNEEKTESHGIKREADGVTQHEMDDVDAARFSLLRFQMPSHHLCESPQGKSLRTFSKNHYEQDLLLSPAPKSNNDNSNDNIDQLSSSELSKGMNSNENTGIINNETVIVVNNVKKEPIKTNISVLDKLNMEHSRIGAQSRMQPPQLPSYLLPVPSSPSQPSDASFSHFPPSDQPTVSTQVYSKYPPPPPLVPGHHYGNYMPYPSPGNAAYYSPPAYPMHQLLYPILSISPPPPTAHAAGYSPHYSSYYSPTFHSIPHRIPMHQSYHYGKPFVVPYADSQGYSNVGSPATSHNSNHPAKSYPNSQKAIEDRMASKEKVSKMKIQTSCLPSSTVVEGSKEKSNLSHNTSSVSISSSSSPTPSPPPPPSSSSSSLLALSIGSISSSLPPSRTAFHFPLTSMAAISTSSFFTEPIERSLSNLVFKSKYRTKVMRTPSNKNAIDILNHMIEKKMLMAMTLTKLKPNNHSMKSPSGKYWEVVNMRQVTGPEKYLVVRSGNKGVNEHGSCNRIKYALFVTIPPTDNDIKLMTSDQHHKIDTSPLKISDIGVAVRRTEDNVLEPVNKVIVDSVKLFKCNAAVLINDHNNSNSNNNNNSNDNNSTSEEKKKIQGANKGSNNDDDDGMDCSPESFSGTALLIKAAEEQLKKEEEQKTNWQISIIYWSTCILCVYSSSF
jgi:hypothetical protein